MSDINWSLLQPVDTGALTMQGFATGQALVKQAQTQHALRAYLAHPEDPKYYNALAAFNPEAAASIQRQQMLRTKMQQDADELTRRKTLGAQFATGDTTGARTGALAAGDLDLAAEFGKLDDATRKRAAETWQNVGPIAFKLKQTKDPEARKALWAQARPILEAGGADPKTLDGFDPLNDTQIEAALTTSQKVSDLIEQGKIVWHQQGEQPSFATDSMGRPVGAQNPYAHNGAPANGQPPPAAAGGFDAAVEHVLNNEGGYNASDMNGKPVNFGINQGANPDVDVKSLTRDRAKQIYHDRYWVPSGAESLPPNMQAPYFDVYIRNPSVAQRALTASGGDPQKFMEISSGYFQHLGQTPNGQKYAKSWANRDSKNLHIATGGGAGGAIHISSVEEYRALKPGTPYIDPNGVARVRQ